jgi:hypothetical protein
MTRCRPGTVATAAQRQARTAIERAHRRARRYRIPARLRAGIRGHRVETPWVPLRIRLFSRLAQDEEPECAGREARSRRGLEQMSDRITIRGLEKDGSYIVEFKIADGEALAISVPRRETAVLEHFQARMPHGLTVPDIPGTEMGGSWDT